MKRIFLALALLFAIVPQANAAFSCSKVSRSLAGNKVMEVWSLNFASVTSGACPTGIANVEFAKFNNEVTEDAGLLKRNTSNGSNSVNGSVYISGVTSSDTGTLLVIGY